MTTVKEDKKVTSSAWTILTKAAETVKIANFYGFTAIEGPKIGKTDGGSFRVALLREISEARGIQLPQPFMFFTKNPDTKTSAHRIESTLSVIGSGKSIVEVILIQAARGILEHAGIKNTIVRINSVGNKESVAEFERKMTAFIRKHFNEFPPELRQLLKKDHLYLTKTQEEKWKEWKDMAPQSIDCLGEESRLHFKEVLEFLECLEIPYVIDGSILGDINIATETVFEIVGDDEKPEIFASGSRYNRLAKKMQLKKEILAADIVISAKVPKAQKIIAIKENKPKFYLVQFGPEAKAKCLIVLEKLRKAGVHVFHALAKDKLTGQMISADQMNIPYILLIGQKEALDNCVVVRNTTNRSQTTVPIAEISDYLKKNIQ